MITRRLRAGLIAGVAALSHCRRQRSRARAVDRLRSDQLRAEHPDRRARASAGQQRNPDAGEPGDVPDQSGAQSGEPALFLARAAPAADHPDPAASRAGAAHRLQREHDRPGVHADLSAGLFRLDLLAAACSPTRRPAGRTRSRASRTPCACRPAWSRTSTPRARRSMRSCRRASPPPARFRPRNPATSSSRFRPRSSPTSPPLMASIARAQSLDAARTLETQAQAQAQTNNFLNYGVRLPARLRADVPLMRGRLLNMPAIGRAVGFALVAVAIVAAALHFRASAAARPGPACESSGRLRSAHRGTAAVPGARDAGEG